MAYMNEIKVFRNKLFSEDGLAFDRIYIRDKYDKEIFIETKNIEEIKNLIDDLLIKYAELKYETNKTTPIQSSK